MLAQVLLVAVSFAVKMASAAVVTVYHVRYERPDAGNYPIIDFQGTVSLSPLPTPVENGMTKYERKQIVSRIIRFNAQHTETLYSSLYTRTLTAAYGASSASITGAPGPLHRTIFYTQAPGALTSEARLGIRQPAYEETCQYFPENGTGTCVEVYLDMRPIPQPTETGTYEQYYVTEPVTVSWSGKMIPYATVTVSSDGSRRVDSTGLALAVVPLTVAFFSMLLGAGLVVNYL